MRPDPVRRPANQVVVGDDGTVVVVVVLGGGAGIDNPSASVIGGVVEPAGGVTVISRVKPGPWGGFNGPIPAMV